MKKMKRWGNKMILGMVSIMLVMLMIPMMKAEAAPTIDTTQKGSITIHKYEYNGAVQAPGNGEAGTPPTGANALKDAGFTLYRVADSSELETYYGKNPTPLPGADDYLTADGSVDTSKVKATIAEQKTDAQGETKFADLPLGIYLVVETTVPPAVTTPIKPFLVSVPMTKTTGDNWLYDVHVYPKNSTKYGEVKIKKTDAKDTAIVLEGVTFVLQKQNADKTGWITITNKGGAAGDNTGDALVLSTDANGFISVDGLTKGTYRFIETSVGLNNTEYIMDGKTVYTFTVNDDGTVTYNTTTDASVIIPVANAKPDITKKVEKKDGSSFAKDSDYSVGDTIKYQVAVEIPNNITSLKKFEIVDTPVHIKDDAATIVIKDGAAEVPSGTVYTASATLDGFTIAFIPSAMTAYAGKTLTLEYTATLLEGAEVAVINNKNTISLEYSNQILPETDDGYNPNKPNLNPPTSVTEDTTTVYSFAIQIHKTGEGAADLQGVTFDLYQEVTSSTAGALTGDAVKGTGLDTAKYWIKVNGATPLTTDVNGLVSQSGLSNGTYYLVETATNEGYNLLSKPIEVPLAITYTTTIKNAYRTTKDGKPALIKSEVTSVAFEESGAAHTGTVEVNVKNSKGFVLPTTGGAGTLLFTLAGCLLIVGGSIILFRTKKKNTGKLSV